MFHAISNKIETPAYPNISRDIELFWSFVDFNRLDKVVNTFWSKYAKKGMFLKDLGLEFKIPRKKYCNCAINSRGF